MIKLSAGLGQIIETIDIENDANVIRAKIVYEAEGTKKITAAVRVIKIWRGYTYKNSDYFLYIGRVQMNRNRNAADIIRIGQSGFFRTFQDAGQVDQVTNDMREWWANGLTQIDVFSQSIKDILDRGW